MARKPRKLNPNRPKAKIVGRLENYPGARYEQDGFYFNTQGVEVLPPGESAGNVVELTEAQEEELAELEKWTKSQKGGDGRLELETYAIESLEMDADKVHDMKVGELRKAIVETAEKQLLEG